MQQIPAIQVLRAIAAIGVAVAHIWGIGVYAGAAGVDLFFVISGFVMVYSSERLFGQPGAATFFVARRIIRIVPLYWAFVAAILYIGFQTTWTDILKTLFFIPYLDARGHYQPIGFVGWTLNYEMFFYAIFASTIIFTRRIAVSISVGALIVLTIVGHAFSLSAAAGYLSNPIILEFAFGCALALAYLEGFRLPRFVAAACVLIGAALIVTVDAPGLDWIRPIVWGLPCAAMVAGACLVKRPWALGDFGAPLHLLGNASYAMYLTHMQLNGYMMQWGHSKAVSFCAVIAFSIFVYYAFEKPIAYIGRIVLKRRRDSVVELNNLPVSVESKTA